MGNTKMSYIIRNDKVIAETLETIKSGTTVQYSFASVEEAINANRELNLVNARSAKISNAKKWHKEAQNAPTAKQINSGEFLI
jgi:hypothetical protein